jgi:hypothetical protein
MVRLSLYLPAGEDRGLDIVEVIQKRVDGGFDPGHRGLE